MLCGWKVKAGIAYFSRGLNVAGDIYLSIQRRVS